MEIGEKIRFWREENKYTQEKLAEKIGFSARAIAAWERGERLPGYDGLLALCDVMNVSADWLLGRKPK